MLHLKQLLKSHGVNQTQLANVLGRDKSAITNLLQGKRQLKATEVVKIAQHLGVSESEVLGITPEPVTAISGVPIPFLQSPGPMMQKSQHVISADSGFSFLDTPLSGEGVFALEVKDESMNLSGCAVGDVAIISTKIPFSSGDIVVIKQEFNGVPRYMLRKYKPPFLLPHSTISSFEKLHEDRETVQLIAPVLRILRQLKSA